MCAMRKKEERMKKTVCKMLGISLAAAMLLAGCGGSGGQTSPASEQNNAGQENVAGSTKDTLVYAMSSDPGTVDPYANMALNLRLSTQVVESLVMYDANGDISPQLAESWEYDEDGKGLTVHLRQNVTFSNGDPLTAEDVVYSCEQAMGNPTYVGALGAFDLASVKAVDDNTVYFPLTGVVGTAHYVLSNVFVVNKNTYEENHAVDIIGTGPFIVERYTAGDAITFKANENYWGGAPAIKHLTMRFITEASVRMTELENGTVDMIDSPTAEDINRVIAGESKGISYQESVRAPKVQFVGINTASVPDIKVRQALLYAIDQEAIFKGAYSSLGELGSGILPGGWWYSSETQGNLPYDPEKAKELLAEAGYNESNPLSVRIAYASNLTERAAAAEIIYNELTSVGVNVTLAGSEQAIVTDQLNNTNDYEMFLTNYGNLFEPGSCLKQKLDSTANVIGGSGYFRYGGTEFGDKIDAELAEALATADDAERAKIYQQIQNDIADYAISKSFVDQKDYGLMTESLQGVWWQPNPCFKEAAFH